MVAGYVGESFWDASTVLKLLLLLFMFIAMCIPAVAAYRNHDKKQMYISILCGLFGMFLLIPWIVSVVMVSRKYEMPAKEKGSVNPWMFISGSIGMIVIGSIIFIRNCTKWGSISGIGLILYGVCLLIVTLMKGKKYWGGLMLVAPLLVSCIDEQFTEALYIIYEVIAGAYVLLILYNVARSRFSTDIPVQAGAVAGKNWSEQIICKAREFKETGKKVLMDENREGARKMKLERCPRGHFYDRAKHEDGCPYCTDLQQTITTPMTVSVPKSDVEILPVQVKPVTSTADETIKVPAEEPCSQKQPETDEDKQINNVQKKTASPVINQSSVQMSENAASVAHQRKQPVVGWLVCIRGVYRGESFILKEGRNFVGRNADMDICLRDDDSIADAKQAAVIYEPRSRQFIIMPGDVHELCYINNEVILSSASMEEYDVLDMGNTSLMLIPCCGKNFSWEDGLTKKAKNYLKYN